MALHPLKLPKSAALLFRFVVLQKQLLGALADPALDADAVDTTWVQNVWSNQDAEWVRKFCLGGQEARIKTIARATPYARRELLIEFCRQNKVPEMLKNGGNFRDLSTIPDFDNALANTVTDFLIASYSLLGQSSNTKGYAFVGGRLITKRIYKDQFQAANPEKIVCPYCDGDMGTSDLDHYYCKSHFPLIACSPWNLVPICKSCNDTANAKGDRLALSPGPPRSTVDWLHPLQCPASEGVTIRLEGNPQDAVPQLHSQDPMEQRRLNNHHWLLDRPDQSEPSKYLSSRWTKAAAAHFDVLVRKVGRQACTTNSIDSIVRIQLEDHQASRGQTASAIVHAAVCQAILDRRPEYLEEITDPNPVKLK